MNRNTSSVIDQIKAELQGKRLLVLNGNPYKKEILNVCDTYGVTLVATGMSQNAGICKVAKEYYQDDSADSEAMKRLIEDSKIDGVYVGANEKVIAKVSGLNGSAQ